MQLSFWYVLGNDYWQQFPPPPAAQEWLPFMVSQVLLCSAWINCKNRVGKWGVTAVSLLPGLKTQYLTSAIPQRWKSRAGRKPVLLKINEGDVFITLQLNCTNLYIAVCKSRLRCITGALFSATQVPVHLGRGLCWVQGCYELYSPSHWEGKK